MKLKELFKGMNLTISDKQEEQYNKYTKLLVEYNEKVNLTAITEENEKKCQSKENKCGNCST